MGHLLLRRGWLLPSAPSRQVFILMGDIPLRLLFSRLSSSSALRLSLWEVWSFHHRHSPELDLLLYAHVSLVLGAQDPTVSPQCRGEGSEGIRPAGDDLPVAPSRLVAPLPEATALACGQLGACQASRQPGKGLQALLAPGCPGGEGAGLPASACSGSRWGKELNPAFYCT